MAEPCLKVLKVFFTAKQNINFFSSSAKLSRKAWQWCGNGNFHGMLVSTKIIQKSQVRFQFEIMDMTFIK